MRATRGGTLELIAEEAAHCRACPLWQCGTQTVFGEGPVPAAAMFVGEQPGDQEDRAGRPFVGPAGGILADALDAVRLDRESVYVTNAVKHFKWQPRGKRRIHQKPNREEVHACHQWLDAELAHVKPDILVVLGATAAPSLLGPSFRVTQHRGEVLRDTGVAPAVVPTVHPSAILRAGDERRAAFDAFVADLRVVRSLLDG